MKAKNELKEDLINLIEYCKYLEWDNKKGTDFDRGQAYGTEHIRQQLEKILDSKWTKWNIRNFPKYLENLQNVTNKDK